jgi:hypothetical protein
MCSLMLSFLVFAAGSAESTPSSRRLLFHVSSPPNSFLGYTALPKLRSPSTRNEQTSNGLYRRINADAYTERQKGVIDEPRFSRLGTCLEVEQRWVDETERDASGQLQSRMP